MADGMKKMADDNAEIVRSMRDDMRTMREAMRAEMLAKNEKLEMEVGELKSIIAPLAHFQRVIYMRTLMKQARDLMAVKLNVTIARFMDDHTREPDALVTRVVAAYGPATAAAGGAVTADDVRQVMGAVDLGNQTAHEADEAYLKFIDTHPTLLALARKFN